ncbi:hypothetical protein HanXRQr2_Chr11g0468281 [Helianthus annuus]|uniref:Transposase (putative) gypsy type domain-containing protein n=1 Tax=Helianthus annuus TaxID=4232 RepID=A0A9K3MY53_HELAN|nr:hypothetical protein HanXRQr2_Chr11g0468281 [Helianthus annuus]
MAEPSSPHNVEGENPERPLVAEEEEDGTAGSGLPALKWTRKSFDRLMLEVQMPSEYGARYPSEGDTGADAPAGYVTMWSDFFVDCNLRLPLTVFVVDILEWYRVHISQVSPFGMIRIRNFEFTFRALGIEPTVGDFRRFYQMTVFMGFFSFRQRDVLLYQVCCPCCGYDVSECDRDDHSRDHCDAQFEISAMVPAAADY